MHGVSTPRAHVCDKEEIRTLNFMAKSHGFLVITDDWLSGHGALAERGRTEAERQRVRLGFDFRKAVELSVRCEFRVARKPRRIHRFDVVGRCVALLISSSMPVQKKRASSGAMLMVSLSSELA